MDPFPPGPPAPREGSSSEGPAPPVPAAPLPSAPSGRNRIAPIVIGVALLAGVGVGIFLARGNGTEPSGDRGSTGSVPAGWTAKTQSADGFGIAIPPGWQELPPGDLEGALDEIRGSNPEMAEVIENQLRGSLSSLVRYFAFDPQSPSLEEGFASNINVVVEPLPAGIDFDRYLQANLTQLQQVPGATVRVEDRNLSLPAGRAALIVTRFTLNGPTREIDVNQYLLLKGRRGFIVSASTTPNHAATYASLFDQIARSLRLL